MNTQTINWSPVNNTIVSLLDIQTSDGYFFDSFNLNDGMSLCTRKVDSDDLQNIRLSKYELAYNNGDGFISRFYRGRTVRFIGTARANTPEEFETLLDTIKQKLSKKEAWLKVRNKKIRATNTSIKYNRDFYNITFSPIEIFFETCDPFWTAWADYYSETGVTGSFAGEVSYTGTAPSSPRFFLVFSSGSNVSNVVLTFWGLSLTVPWSFVSGDVLLIDAEKKEVKKNSTDIDFTGVFPEFSELSNPFTFAFTGAISADMTLIYNTNYL